MNATPPGPRLDATPWDNRSPGSCPCGFLVRSNCLDLKLALICDYPSAEPPPARDRYTYATQRPPRARAPRA